MADQAVATRRDPDVESRGRSRKDRRMADAQKVLMRSMGALNVWLYRASGGRVMGRVRGYPVLLLTVAGRRTGVEHPTPVGYFEDNGRYVVTGSAGGSPSEPQWFRNLRHADR